MKNMSASLLSPLKRRNGASGEAFGELRTHFWMTGVAVIKIGVAVIKIAYMPG